jgi:site-specific DNA-adenine methylase
VEIVMKNYNHRGWLIVIYCDPPYYNLDDTKYSSKGFDHVAFATLLKTLPDNIHIFISYNNHPIIRELYNNWFIKILGKREKMGKKELVKVRTEILISNHKIQEHQEGQKKLLEYL